MFGMSDDADDSGRQPTRREISDATESSGWRYILGVLRTAVRVGSLAQGAEVTAQAVAAVGADADETLSIDVRHDSVVLTLQTAATASVTRHDIAAARRISEALLGLGLQTDPDVEAAPRRSVQILEIAIDATDIAAIRPFWKAVMGYGDEAGRSGPEDPVVDPVGQGPAIWFQQMDTPRPSATESTSTSRFLTTRRRDGSGPPSTPTAAWCRTRGRLRSGSWPIRKATRHASRPGRDATASPAWLAAGTWFEIASHRSA